MGVELIQGSSVNEIAESIERAIRSGALPQGVPLPPIRTLAAQLGVNRNTAMAAYRRLADRGFLEAGGRRGTRVMRNPFSLPSASSGVVDLSSGDPDPLLLPTLNFNTADFAGHRRSYDAPWELPELLTVLSAVAANDGLPQTSFAFANGAFDALACILLTAVSRGERVAVEDPCYMTTLPLLNYLGLEPVGLSLDEHGVVPDSLERALATGCKAVILTPYAQNPTGASWSAERTQELRAVVTKYRDALIVEDDYLSPFYDELQTLSSDERPRWAVIRSVSKYIGPDLRFAYICGSNDTVRAVRGMRSFTSRWVTRIVQQCVLQVLSDPATPALFAQAAKTYAERQAAMMAALAKRGIGAMGNTGINVWIPVPNEDAFSLALHRRGWAVRTGSIFRLASPPALRVATSRLTPAQVESFADDLAAIFSEPPVDYGA